MQVSKNGTRHFLGSFLRGAGQSVASIGRWLQGSTAQIDRLNRHRRLMNFGGHVPKVGDEVFVAPSAHVIGNVTVGQESSIWYNTIVRGDASNVSIGEKSNIQDRVVIHAASSNSNDTVTSIGNRVTVEGSAILHACKLEDECYIGIGASVLDGAVVGSRSMVAPGSVVTAGTEIPSGQLWAGSPAKFLRELSVEEKKSISEMASDMFLLAEEHRAACALTHEDLLREIETSEFKERRLDNYEYHPTNVEEH